ncbi:MAG: 4-(cytidine 5'-diphospho)-2-C-methyl-D-erythritol kinase [Chloroflexi bacterium]|nr:4-(cytidine 5'-diphospho)-2-C-methyl-D-erythritol kinase [Chloroflexota bacterium]
MRVYAPAKINWTLEVLGRRDDGYHEVRSVMQTIDLCDVLDFAPAEALSLQGGGEYEPGEDDLILKAAGALGLEGQGAAIRLGKKIPLASGLGGGSSDAAATLRGLGHARGLTLSQNQLAEVAAGLGSDVPFFTHGGTALVEGRGERVTPLPDAPPAWLVLAVPPLTVTGKTATMYRNLSPSAFSDGSFTRRFVQRLEEGAIDEQSMRNAFEGVAYALFPDLARYRAALLDAAGAGARPVHLAGSGPALFVLAREEQEARRIHQDLRLPGGESFVCRTLTAAEALRVEE